MDLPSDYRTPPPSAESPLIPWRIDPRWVIVGGIALWILGYIVAMISSPQGASPAIFLPTAITVGVLLRLPLRLWVWALGTIAAIDLIGGPLATADGFAANAMWAVANTVEPLAIAALLRGWRVDMSRARDPLMIFLAAGTVVAVCAVPGVLVLDALGRGRAEDLWPGWWGGDVLAIVLVVPVVLLLGRAALPRGRAGIEAAGWFVITLLFVATVFAETADPVLPVWVWLIMGAPLVVLYGVRFGTLAMSLFLLVLDFVAVSFTAAGRGPFQTLALGAGGAPLRSVQTVLMILAVTSLSVCVLINRGLGHGRRLAEQQALFDAVIQGSPVATALLAVGPGAHIREANRAYRDLVAAATPGDSLLDLFSPDEAAAVARLVESANPGDVDAATGEFTMRNGDGDPRLLRVRVAAVSADEFDRFGSVQQGANLARVVHLEDVTDARIRENRLRRDALTDPLTGLANRRRLLAVLSASIPRAAAGHLLTVALWIWTASRRSTTDSAMRPETGSCKPWRSASGMSSGPATWSRGPGATSSSW